MVGSAAGRPIGDEAGRASRGWNFGRVTKIGDDEAEVWYWQGRAVGRIP